MIENHDRFFWMSGDIFLCFSCGQRNRVSPESNLAAAKCGNCGAALFPAEAPAAKTNPHSNCPSSSNPSSSNNHWPQSKSNSGIGKTILGLAVIVFFGWLAFGASESQDTRPRPTTVAQVSANLPSPVTQAPGVMWNKTGRRARAPLRIETSRGADYYVKLVDATTGAEAMAIYVSGGRLLEVEVPLGSYRFRYASGETWRGEQALFGPRTSTYEADERFNFIVQGNRLTDYTIELIRQTGGNLPTHLIPRSQF